VQTRIQQDLTFIRFINQIFLSRQ